MKMMALGMFIFLAAIGIATFVESIYDIQTAKIWIYNARWFEILLAYLGINLVANIFSYRMYQREKIAVLMFHLAFIVILIGAAITRFVSFEGLMIIDEGGQADFIYSAEPKLWFKVNDGSKQFTYNDKLYMSEHAWNDFTISFDFPGKQNEISIEYVDFKKNLVDSLVIHDSIQAAAFEIVTNGMKSNFLTENNILPVGSAIISYREGDSPADIQVMKKGPKTMIRTKIPMRSISMSQLQSPGQEVHDSMYTEIPMDTLVPFQSMSLYTMQDGSQFMFRGVKEHAKMMKLPSDVKGAGKDILTIRIIDGVLEKLVYLAGGKDAIPEEELFMLNGLTYQMQYGAVPIQLPFAIACRDFQLERYPGSESPSSFASEVTIIDNEKKYKRDQRIFMNNVMDYGGYRFFQSGYTPDEKATKLSVNHDWWGTNVSYLGYLMMGIGMLLSLIMPGGRFRALVKMTRKAAAKHKEIVSSVIIGLSIGTLSFAQTEVAVHDHSKHDSTHQVSRPEVDPTFRIMSEEHSDIAASLLVQDVSGRIIPLHTMCDQILRKLYRNNKFEEYNAVQTVFSMHMYPDYWMEQDIIYVSSKSNLREKLALEGSYASYKILTDANGEFIYLNEYRKAHQTLESKRGEYEKQLIKLADKYEVARAVFGWRYMLVVPLVEDENNTWISPLNLSYLQSEPDGIKKGIRYLSALDSASANFKSYNDAEIALKGLKEYQYDIGKNVTPDPSIVEMEIKYNGMNIFGKSFKAYILFGLLALIIFYIKIFIRPKPSVEKLFNRISIGITILTSFVFLYHGYGLYMRWMISGHAPWSNSYEAVIFIAWVSMAFGLVFGRRNAVILGSVAILASLMLFVTEMNLLDPDITPLQPVLKSYWLMIHVAVITGSYGPLGIACILGFMNLILYIFRTQKNAELTNVFIKQITSVSEMSMTIGVFMLTIGTFLGGIWANESWGRYWGWDPKETWALVGVLTYAVILHLRYIPALKSKFTFNVVSMWAYTVILFTFFGVNFYLVGLHSYAQGEGLGKIPNSLILTVVIFILFTVVASIRNRKYNRDKGQIKITLDE